MALARLCAYHRAQGDRVILGFGEITYASQIFDFTNPQTVPDGTVWGGSGIDLTTELPPEVEACRPDFSLWGIDYALGLTTRGCIRRCPFCVVPRKEGKLRVVAELDDVWQGESHLRLLDANLTGVPEHFERLLIQLAGRGICVDFNQGLDARLLTSDQARLLRKVKLWKALHLAFDHPSEEEDVRRAVRLLHEAGHPLTHLMFYVLTGFDTTQQEDIHRIEVLRSLGVRPYVMRFRKPDRTGDEKQRLSDVARWARPEFTNTPFSEWKRSKPITVAQDECQGVLL